MYAQHLQQIPKEVRLNTFIRQTHRRFAIVFTLTVIANFAAMMFGPVPALITYSPLPPLLLMLVTGLYMFFLPYTPKNRAGA
jgi:hypothetical protein